MRTTVKEDRLKKNWTQTELAEMIGVSRQTIFSIEISKYVPSITLSLKIAEAPGKRVEEVFILERKD